LRKIVGPANRAKFRLNRASGLASLTFALAANTAVAATVFDQLYPAKDGELSLPYPFSALVDDLRARTGAEIQVGFIPLGRSLQRFAADPDYFSSPRIILAVAGKGKSATPLRDRLFMGYQPAANAVEIIAFDEVKNQFRFLQVEDYRAEGRQTLTGIDEQTCVSCHQSRAPIFAAPPWDESNANPKVVAMLPGAVEGLAVRQDFDGIDQFARSVQRANRLAAAIGLKHALSTMSPSESLIKAFPDGVSIIDPKIPNRDPVTLLNSGSPLLKVLQAEGVFDPETKRRPVSVWRPGLTAVEDATAVIEEAGVR
jgi:mono/diheme cytochrome c family protein